MNERYQEVHLKRLELLTEILRVTDIELNALKINDVDILENALTEKESLISDHDTLVASVPDYETSSEYHHTEVIEILKKIQDHEEKAFEAYAEMKKHFQSEDQDNRKKKNALNKQKSVEKAYGQRSGRSGSVAFDRKK